MSSNQKVVIINGKRFVVGNSKIKPTKCHLDDKRKKLLNKEEKLSLVLEKRRKNKMLKLRRPKTTSRRVRDE